MSSYEDQPIPRAELHYGDTDTVTIAVTFRWRKPWAMDKCEVGCLVGDLSRSLYEHYRNWDQLAALESVLTWDSCEELLIGSHVTSRPILFPSGEPELTERDLELQQARRDLSASIHEATYAAHGGEFGSITMLASAAEGIRDALAIICPHQEGNDAEWTAIDRRSELDAAIRRALRSQVWTADTLNAACTSALRITKNRDTRRLEYR